MANYLQSRMQESSDLLEAQLLYQLLKQSQHQSLYHTTFALYLSYSRRLISNSHYTLIIIHSLSLHSK